MQVVTVYGASEVRENLTSRAIGGRVDGQNMHSLFGRGQLAIHLGKLEEAAEIAELTGVILNGDNHSSRTSFNSTRDIEQRIKRGRFLLAEKDDIIVGVAYLEPRTEASRLDLLAVCPSQRHSGVGSQLLYAAERLSASMRCLFMHIHVINLHRETIKFCRRRGYVEFGIEALDGQQPVSPHCHIVRMCKRLDVDCLVF